MEGGKMRAKRQTEEKRNRKGEGQNKREGWNEKDEG